ncbi:pyruvate, phosphate dikinase [Candidatus Marinamargulisbacteria bacterium SCGC AG-410-N11]|nr:pyruvate, phosphate dikinase [Candidatus Marinamargulisbacteria bacterium SCGC AG-410-N11]
MTVTETRVKSVYFFGGNQTEGKANMRNTIGGKGANLAEMSLLEIPVPPGFTIETKECARFYENNKSISEETRHQIDLNIQKVEEMQGKKFGDNDNPLLMSVRSGARVSMPGMMDTILNLGLNDDAVEGLSKQSNSPRFAWDSYRRFIQMFCNVVLGVSHSGFEDILENKKQEKGYTLDTDLTVEDLKDIVNQYKSFVSSKGKSFPQDPKEQLLMSIGAVFQSWEADRAKVYRRINGIPHHWGTAVNVQAMVFGNLGEDSGTGVAFTRNPSTGENVFYGEYLVNAQGEDVVAGIRTPEPIKKLDQQMPAIYSELVDIYKKLENHFKDMQDLEFTIENKKLYILQTRVGKRTAASAIKIAVDMVDENLIDKREAVLRVKPDQINQLLHPTIDKSFKPNVLAKGLPASPGAAVGKIVLTADKAEEMKAKNEQVILVRQETSPEDIGGMHAAEGILTAKGGMTSHAAVVARGMGKCCIAGCSDINILKGKVEINGEEFNEGDFITLNGTSGEVIKGQAPLSKPELTGDYQKIMQWSDEFRKINVRTNAETIQEVKTALEFGAEGIGLCRTEHMFFDETRIKLVRQMILSESTQDRESVLDKLFTPQKNDFKEIFQAMDGLPITIRLLDPPLHEFLPHDNESISDIAQTQGISVEKVNKTIENLKELNPMLGHRGCRLGITYPEIYKMQVKAIIESAVEVQKEGKTVLPEIMVPLISGDKEFKNIKKLIQETAQNILTKHQIKLEYQIGTMIEIPRAALLADKIAEEAEFFSFGTNDLTQMVYGLSRDDSGAFLPEYVEKEVFPEDPFQVLDQDGVGELMKIAFNKGKQTNPNLKVGICGEHGGEPSSVEFCVKIGFDYVSCSPFRVPIARLAAAHQAIKG